MNPSSERCLRCCAILPDGVMPGNDPKCLLQTGLATGTDIDSAPFTQTIPPSDGPSTVSNRSASTHDDVMGIGVYRDLQAIHDLRKEI